MMLRLGPGGVLVLGLLVLAAGAVMALRTHTFIAGALQADGTVAYTTRRSLGVWVESPPGQQRLVSVPKPWYSLPGRYRNGVPVRILYDPDYYDVQLFDLSPLFAAPRARLASSFHIWFSTAVAIVLGGVCVLLYAVSARSRGRCRTEVRIRTTGRDS